MRPSAPAALSAFLLAASSMLSALAAMSAVPTQFPMPDGDVETRDERDVAPYLSAWQALAMSRQDGQGTLVATPNQMAYDAHWYDLNLTFTPASTAISGTVRMKASVVAGPLSFVELDMSTALIVDATTSASLPAAFSRAGNLLMITLDRAYTNGEIVDVTVTYHGNPTSGGSVVYTTVNARQMIWSLSEPYGARTWWPCKDVPEDKADSVDIRFTVPTGMVTASNGTLISTTPGAGTSTTYWRERYPIVTYLVSIASYPYTVTEDWYRPSPLDSMLIRFHMVPESAAGAAAVHAKVKDMIAAFASRMGEYPFINEKYGHAQFTFGGGQEHQTCTSLGTYNESVVAHELMHQWWGDMVTCRDFHHIWLNEGFATYGEAMWLESLGGLPALHGDMKLNRFFGPGSVYVPDDNNTSRIFDSNLSYNKASWVLHMLRHVLGDSTFFAALLEYRAQWEHKSAVTEDFQAACEFVSGRDLDAFFQQWVYGEYYPVYFADWSSEAAPGGGHDVTLTLEQRQSWQLFNMPVDITVTTASSETTFVVRDSLASQTFVLHVGDTPTALTVDRDGWILKKIEAQFANTVFDKSVLVVNGIDWATYGSEITTAYADQAFSGAYAIDFWDTFTTPAGGYPAPLPAPLGYGSVPVEVLSRYRNVVWVGNNFGGDLSSWQDTPVLAYLRAGGNLLLLARQGSQFVDDSLRAYLGINWISTSTTLNDCIATRPGFTNMALLGAQNLCAVFDTVRTTPESHLLMRVASGFTPSRGIGAIRVPAGGAGSRPNGGRFAFVSGRPYRWNHAQLAANVTQILNAWFLEPVTLLEAPPARATALRVEMANVGANPSGGATALRFTLPRAAEARLQIFDIGGRHVRTLASGRIDAGRHDRAWDGRDDIGAGVASGLYWAVLDAAGERAQCRIVRVR